MTDNGPTWYTATIDYRDGGQWQPVERPFTEVWEGVPDPESVARQIAARYSLNPGGAWRVRVFAGYARFDDLLAELFGGERDQQASAAEPAEAGRVAADRKYGERVG